MPMLRPKREAFAHAVLRSAKNGKSLAACYIESGYRARGHAAESNASRLLNFAEVKMRLEELARPAVQKTRVTVESLLDQLDETITAARADGAHGVVVSALTLSAKLVGLLRERIEIGGAGEFAGAKTVEDIVGMFIADNGGPAEALEMLDVLRTEVERRAGDHALVVSENVT
jgi:hypothetical protein